MTDCVDRQWVEELLQRNRYLVLSTTNGTEPWIAPLEYILDADLNFYFFSPENARHSRHLERNSNVAVAVFDSQQPDYSPGTSVTIQGVQIEATASKLDEADYPEVIVSGIAALKPPMPPYAVFTIHTRRFYVPKIENGVNIRVEVNMDRANSDATV